jgi:uncharacterized protein (DUF2147 family)
MSTPDNRRRNDIDALRVLATFLLFPFHVAMIFSPAPFYHVRNDELSIVALIFTGFVSLWHMPLFFLLAGWSAVASLRARGAAAFARERFSRLLVPLVVGCVLFAPAIKFIELRGGQDLNHRGLFVSPEVAPSFATVIPEPLPVMTPFDERFIDFLPTFFTTLDRFTWSHLWFVAYLFTLSLVWLPLLARVAREPRANAAEFHEHRQDSGTVSAALVYAPVLPLALVQIFLRPYWPGVQNLYDDWANVAYYSIYLLLGAAIASRGAFERAIHGEWRRALAVSLVALLALLSAVLGVLKSEPTVLALTAIAGWSFTVFLLGAATRLELRSRRALAYLSEASMPIYVLHQPAIVFLGVLVVSWPLGAVAKFALILVGSIAVTLAAYDLLVRRLQPLRIALGMKLLACAIRPRSRASIAATALVLALGSVTEAATTSTESPLGLWWAEGGAAQVRLESCGNGICGRIVWLRSPFDENGCILRDRHNGDPALRVRDILGLEIVQNLQPDEDAEAEWNGGTIYDPTTGFTYSCALRLRDSDRLELRGYLGLRLLGRTVTWTRVGSEERICRE